MLLMFGLVSIIIIIDLTFTIIDFFERERERERGWAMIAHERIALRCSAYLWGVATLGRVAGEIRVNGGGWC